MATTAMRETPAATAAVGERPRIQALPSAASPLSSSSLVEGAPPLPVEDVGRPVDVPSGPDAPEGEVDWDPEDPWSVVRPAAVLDVGLSVAVVGPVVGEGRPPSVDVGPAVVVGLECGASVTEGVMVGDARGVGIDPRVTDGPGVPDADTPVPSSGVGVGVGVGVCEGRDPPVGVVEGVGVGVGVGVREGRGSPVGADEAVGVGLGVGVSEASGVGVGEGEGVGDGLGVAVGVGEAEGAGDDVGDVDGPGVGMGKTRDSPVG